MWLSVVISSAAWGASVGDDSAAAALTVLLGEALGAGVGVGLFENQLVDVAPEPLIVGLSGLGGVLGGASVTYFRRPGSLERVVLASGAAALAATGATGLGTLLRDDVAPNAPEAYNAAYATSAVLLVLGVPAAAGLALSASPEGGSGGGKAPWMVSAGPNGMRVAGRF